MKKTYIKPVLTIVRVETKVSIFTGSNPDLDVNIGGSEDPDKLDSHAQNDWDIWSDDDVDYDYNDEY